MTTCICCGQPATRSILLALGPQHHGRPDERYYLPNQSARGPHGNAEERWFCDTHMRALEDSLRATIAYHQAENAAKPKPLK